MTLITFGYYISILMPSLFSRTDSELASLLLLLFPHRLFWFLRDRYTPNHSQSIRCNTVHGAEAKASVLQIICNCFAEVCLSRWLIIKLSLKTELPAQASHLNSAYITACYLWKTQACVGGLRVKCKHFGLERGICQWWGITDASAVPRAGTRFSICPPQASPTSLMQTVPAQPPSSAERSKDQSLRARWETSWPAMFGSWTAQSDQFLLMKQSHRFVYAWIAWMSYILATRTSFF